MNYNKNNLGLYFYKILEALTRILTQCGYGASSLLSFSLQRNKMLVKVKDTSLVAAVEFSRPASCLGLHATADAGIKSTIHRADKILEYTFVFKFTRNFTEK